MNGSIFNILASVFRKNDVWPVLVGGYAINAYKVQRMTFDIDFILSTEDCLKIEPDIIALGYTIANRTEAFIQFKSENPGLRDLDLLITDTKTVEKLRLQGQKVSIAGETFTVPSILHLIAMKVHSITQEKQRELKDLPDVVQLITRNGLDPETPEIRQLFVKYNALELHAKLIELSKKA